ncbi:hypothetical protein ABKS89_22110 [Pseudomonas sp. LABIM340]|uniref:hypothetical protein n=1 Tax=Pseudomonas sp. LABIM340 TaxID=3156585 RepID=UPI0032AEFAD7
MENPRFISPSPWKRRAGQLQWFGLVLLCLAVGLAALTDLASQREGVVTIAICFVLGLMALVLARVILMRPAG